MEQKSFWQIIKEVSILIGIGVIALVILNWTTDIFKPSEKIIEKKIVEKTIITTSSIPVYPEFDSFSGMHRLILFSRVKSYTPNRDTETYSYKKHLQVSGEFSRIYLYTEASFNDGKLTGSQDLYIKFQDYGGHIKNKPLPVPEGKISRLLYNIDNVQYVEKIDNPKIDAVSWLNIFNDLARSGKNIRMDVFISSLKEAWIEKMELYYQCSRDAECSIIEIK